MYDQQPDSMNNMFDDEINEDLKYLAEKTPIVFKYTRVENFETMIANSSLLFKNPSLFNDPYDCYPDLIDFDKVPNNFREYIIEKFRPFLSGAKVEEIIKQLKNKSDSELAKIFRNEVFPIEQSTLAVTCFSEKNDNLLIWSHYSDSHKGICLGFDLRKLYLNFKIYFPALIKVKYTNKLERVDYFADKKKAIINWFRIKSDCWEYEKEVRIVLTNIKMDSSRQKAIPFDTKSISSIYLGTNIKPDDENKIRLLALNKIPETKISKMRLKEDSFSLIPE
jgi:hypothetical protein